MPLVCIEYSGTVEGFVDADPDDLDAWILAIESLWIEIGPECPDSGEQAEMGEHWIKDTLLDEKE